MTTQQSLRLMYGDEVIYCKRRIRTSQSSRVLIKVHPDCRVDVLAPAQASDAEVLAALNKRSRWIYQQLKTFRAQLEYIRPRQYLSGESHYYLGRQYQLKLIEDHASPQGVKLLRGRLNVHVRQKETEKVQQLLADWYKMRAKEVFNRRLDALLEHALWVNERPPIQVLSMQTQWGNCSPQGRISLNTHLVKAPTRCIDYVILHELCHLAEHNHSERFYQLMGQVMPHWEETKAQLDNMAARILNKALNTNQ